MLEGLSKIQHALTDRIEGRDVIKNRAAKIRNLAGGEGQERLLQDIRVFANWFRDPEPKFLDNAYHPFGYEDSSKKEPSPEEVVKVEDYLTAYLIQSLEKKKANEHFYVREDQIQSIVALLRKDHLQSPTGSGKSSVILPIASLVKAVSENGLIDVVSASDELTGELKQNIADINNLLPEHLRVDMEDSEKQKTDNKSVKQRQDLAHRLIKKVVKGTDDTNISKLQFELLFGRPPIPNAAQTKLQRAKIKTFKDDDYVFWKMKDNSDITTHTYWDEVHVPYDRASPYLVSGEGIPTEKSVNNYLFERIVSGAMADQIDTWETGGLLEQKKGHFDIGTGYTKGRKKSPRYKQRENKFYEMFKQTLAESVSTSSDQTSKLGAEIQKVAAGVGVDFQELKKWFAQELNERIEDGELENIITEHRLALMRAKAIKAGKEYSIKDGLVVSRDPYMGISLPGRQYHPDILLALQSLNGEVNYFNFIKSAADMTTFEGFIVNKLKGKVSGLSGTLKVRSLSSSESEKSPLARFLTQSSAGSIFATEVPGQKPKEVPTPKYIHENSKIDSIIATILSSDKKNKRPVAIFALNETEGEQLRNRLNVELKGRAVLFVSDNLTETETQRFYREFADSDGAILVSTGRAGVGIDIKRSGNPNDPFPDFLTIIDGLPQSRAQMFQMLGRRRRSSESYANDYRWIFDKTDLTEHDGLKKQEQRKIDKKVNLVRELAADPGTHLHMLLRELDTILQRAEDQLTDDTTVNAGFDDYYKKALGTLTLHGKTIGYGHLIETEKQNVYYGLLERVVEQNFNPRELRLLNMLLEQFVKKEGRDDALSTMFYGYLQAPSSLYYDLKNLLGFSEGQQASARLADFAFKVSGYFDEPGMFEHWLNLRSEEFVEVMRGCLAFLDAQLRSEAHTSADAILSGTSRLVGLERRIIGEGNEKDIGEYQPYVIAPNRVIVTYTDLYNGPKIFVFESPDTKMPYVYDPQRTDIFMLYGGPLSLAVERKKTQ